MKNIEIVKPNKSLQFIGFDSLDIDRLSKVLEKMNINLIDDELRTLDLNDLSFLIVSNKEFRDNFISSFKELYPNLKDELINTLDLSLKDYHSKWNLFLLCLMFDDQSLDQLLLIQQDYPLYVVSVIDSFLEMKRRGYKGKNDIYNIIQKCNAIERTGWLNAEVPTEHKESIAEHMFNMYHLGSIYLTNNDGYNKERVLKLIMVHDLAETIIGDIAHPYKTANDDKKEDLAAKALFCSLMYYSEDSSYYEYWCEWEERITIESLIAHDLDSLQFNYQFMTYACKYPDCFSDDDVELWMRRRPKTELGLKLFNELIMENPLFKKRVGSVNGK